ncbi:MAG: sirohydrochlorin cobaltochelatase [Firmicutes bacterium]|nr:sirohydrochlorin cobaltochelatase [Bacillota bacterium]
MTKALLVISFGTSHRETRRATIERIEQDLAAAFPDRKFYRAWTSGFIRRRLLEQEGIACDSVAEALERLLSDGVTDLLVQPTHMLAGREANAALAEVRACRDSFARLAVGEPLLASADDIQALARALETIYGDTPEDCLLGLMGHGSADSAGNPYLELAACFDADGFSRFAVGTVEEEPGFAPILERARLRQPRLIRLAPLMVVAGDHAVNDMAGAEEDSWACRLQRAGFATECVLRGLGEYATLRQLYLEHARAARPVKC